MANGNASIKGYNCNVSQGLVIIMPLPDFRLIRLLPLAALVLTACSVTTPKGLAKARIRHNGVSISKTCAILISIKLAARSLIFLTNKKCTPVSSGNKLVGSLPSAAD